MDFPAFYHPERVGEHFVPDVEAVVAAGSTVALSPADAPLRTLLLLVDMQVDFVHAEGALSVPGAIDDTHRIIEWIFRNLSYINTIATSLDSHLPMSIFFPTWWVDQNGQHPQPYTVIRSADVQSGRWKPLYEVEWSREYTEKLEAGAKKELMIWPYHTLIGTPEHALMPALYEAIVYHSAARQTQPIFLEKGTIPKAEYYSILEPEVKVPDDPRGGLNNSFLNMLATYDRIYISGEAKSHCVLETVTSIMHYYGDQPAVIDKFRILQDCMSSVAHPTIDFDALANQAFASYARKGLQMVMSSDPLH